MKSNRFTLRQIVLVGVMAALVFATSNLRITIPLPIDKAAVHLGNVMCVLSGLLLGPVGGIASGLGSFFFDLFNPLYASEAWITLLTKSTIGLVAGLIAHHGDRRGLQYKWNMVGGVAGSVTYVIVYMLKSWIFSIYVFGLAPGMPLVISLAPKMITSLMNGIIAVAVAVPLSAALQTALRKSGLLQLPQRHAQ